MGQKRVHLQNGQPFVPASLLHRFALQPLLKGVASIRKIRTVVIWSFRSVKGFFQHNGCEVVKLTFAFRESGTPFLDFDC